VQVIDPSVLHPVTFTSDAAHIRVAAPWTSSAGGRVEFHFRTVEPTGLMLYSSPGSGGGSLSIELYDGRLYVNVDDGSTGGFRKYALDARSERVDDGRARHVSVQLDNDVVRMSLDDFQRVER